MKRILYFIFVFLLVFAMASCASKKDPALTQDEINARILESENQSGQGSIAPEGTPTAKKIGIYTIEDESLDTVSIETVVEYKDELKVEDVITAVVSELEDHDIDIKIGSVTNEGNKVTIDLKADDSFLPFGSLGSSAEGSVLDCLSYSVFDNFSDVKEVYFLVNGEAYETGHIELKKDEPYLTR
ncbi:MAG: GerMN domain-containing protein [Lachnospiraceae bacterium]|nr:GerMN domain-containing protein [Lachnospiraceae bacterium]